MVVPTRRGARRCRQHPPHDGGQPRRLRAWPRRHEAPRTRARIHNVWVGVHSFLEFLPLHRCQRHVRVPQRRGAAGYRPKVLSARRGWLPSVAAKWADECNDVEHWCSPSFHRPRACLIIIMFPLDLLIRFHWVPVCGLCISYRYWSSVSSSVHGERVLGGVVDSEGPCLNSERPHLRL